MPDYIRQPSYGLLPMTGGSWMLCLLFFSLTLCRPFPFVLAQCYLHLQRFAFSQSLPWWFNLWFCVALLITHGRKWLPCYHLHSSLQLFFLIKEINGKQLCIRSSLALLIAQRAKLLYKYDSYHRCGNTDYSLTFWHPPLLRGLYGIPKFKGL